MSRNVNISPLLNSIKIHTNGGEFFWLRPNGNLNTTLNNLVIYNKKEMLLSADEDITIKCKTSNKNVKIQSLLGDVIIESENNMTLTTNNLNINTDVINYNVNTSSLTSDSRLLNIGSVTHNSPLGSGDYYINVQNNLDLDSRDISISALEFLNISASNTNRGPTDPEPEIQIGLTTGLHMVNDNIIFGHDNINEYNLTYDKKFNIALNDSTINEYDGLYVSSYGNIKPEIGIKKFKIVSDGTSSLIPYQTSSIVLGSDESNSYLDINSKGNFNIIKNKSKMIELSSLNGATIGNTDNITSNISGLDIIKADSTIIDTQLQINSNYYDVFNLNQYDYNIYAILEHTQTNLYKIKLLGKPFIESNYETFEEVVITIVPTVIDNLLYKPKLSCIIDGDNILVMVAWYVIIDTNYRIKSKYYTIDLNASDSDSMVTNLSITDELLFDSSSTTKNSFIEEINIQIINNHFIINWIEDQTIANPLFVLKTKLLIYNGSSGFDIYDNETSSSNEIVTPKICYLNNYNGIEYYFVQIVKMISNNIYKLHFKYGKFHQPSLNLHIPTDFSPLDFYSSQPLYNYNIDKYSVCKSNFDSDTINLDFFVSWYSQFNSNIIDSEVSASSGLSIKLESDPAFSVVIDNVIGNEIYTVSNQFTNSSNDTRIINEGDIVYIGDTTSYSIKKITDVELSGSLFKITLSDDLYKVIGINYKSNLDTTQIGTSIVNIINGSELTQNIDNISNLLNIGSDQLGYVNCNVINLSSTIKNELNINNNYLVVNWQNRNNNILRLEYANINLTTLQIISKNVKNTQDLNQNVNLHNNRSINVNYNNENLLIILFNKFSDSSSENNLIQFTTIHHPEIPIIRVSDIDTSGTQNIITNDFSIGYSGINYRKEDPNFSLINTNSDNNLDTDLDFKYLDTSNNLLNIAKIRATKLSSNEHSLKIIVANNSGQFDDLVGIKFLNNGLASSKFSGSSQEDNSITLTDNLSILGNLEIRRDEIAETTYVNNYTDTQLNFETVKNNFRVGDKFLMGNAPIDVTSNIFSVISKFGDSFLLETYQGSISSSLQTNMSLLPSIMYATDYANSTKLLLDYFGNLGLGTSNPKYNLDLSSDSSNINLTSISQNSSGNFNNNIIFSYKDSINNLLLNDFKIEYEKSDLSSNIKFQIDGRTGRVNETPNWIQKMTINSNHICMGQVPSIIPPYIFSVVGDGGQNTKPNLAIKNTVYAPAAGSGVNDFQLFGSRISFLGDTYEYGRISSRINNNISDITSNTQKGCLEFRTSDSSIENGGLLFLNNSSYLGINMGDPKTYLDINSDNVLTTSFRGDLNIWNQNLETSISFSKGTNNDPKSFISYIEDPVDTTLLKNITIQFRDSANDIITNNFHMTNNSNLIIGQSNRFYNSAVPYSISSDDFSALNTLTIKNLVGTLSRCPQEYSHIYSSQDSFSSLGLSTLFFMPSSAPGQTINNNIDYMIGGIKISQVNNDYFSNINDSFDGANVVLNSKRPPLGFTHLKYGTYDGSTLESPEFKIHSIHINSTTSTFLNKNWFNIPIYYKSDSLDLFKIHQDFSDHTNDKIGINIAGNPQYTLDVNGTISGNMNIKSETSDYQIVEQNSTTFNDTNMYLLESNFTIPNTHHENGSIITIKNITTTTFSIETTDSKTIQIGTSAPTSSISATQYFKIKLIYYNDVFYEI